MIARVAHGLGDFDAADRLVAELYGNAGLPIVPSPDYPKIVLLVIDTYDTTVGQTGPPGLVGTLTLTFCDAVVMAGCLAVRPGNSVLTWRALIDEALKQILDRGIKVLAATVKPGMQRRWERSLGLVAVSSGSYDALGGVPAVVMVGSVDAMCKQWERNCKS